MENGKGPLPIHVEGHAPLGGPFQPGRSPLEKGWVDSGVSLGVPCVLFRDFMIWSCPWSWVSNRVRS